MSYVDSLYDKNKNLVRVVERVNGERRFIDYPADYIFYYNDSRGKYRSIYGNKLSKVKCKTEKEFSKEKILKINYDLYESDISPIARCLETVYKGIEPPNLQTAFFDIEVDFHKVKGYSTVEDPFNKVTAISTYLNWCDTLVTQVIAPDTLTHSEATEICERYENCILYKDEKDMLLEWLDVLQDADILSGWNSEGYDIPYLVNRITRVLGKEYTKRLCLWGRYPKKRQFERFGKKDNLSFDLQGRIHLDYMQLYRNYTYHEMHSYSLDAIGEHELKERKVPYEGTLDELYNNDFPKFIEYNRQDTLLLDKLDKKLKYIELANSVAHDNTVLLPKTLGAVAMTEQAIINEAHELGLIVPDRDRSGSEGKAAGAYVAYPKKGLHKWLGSIDLNSLYPSTLQALNMSNETIVGQLRPTETDKYIEDKMADKIDPVTGKKIKGLTFAAAWEGLFGIFEYEAVMDQREDYMVTIDWEKKTQDNVAAFLGMADETTLTAKQAYELIFESDQNWVVSSNGTIFSLDNPGVIPGLLKRWYSERKYLQKNKGLWKSLKDGIDLFENAKELNIVGMGGNPDFDVLMNLIKSENKSELIEFISTHNLCTKDGMIFHNRDAEVKYQINHWDKRQHVKKINLNSLYGALLNNGCRFYDKRIGQSTTLVGRAIARHMDAHTNECLTGEYDYTGDCIIYGDTDSVYFSAWPVIKDKVEKNEMEWNADIAVDLYNQIGDNVNESFPGFMKKAFNCPREYGQVIAAKRETVGISGLFITKKRYAIMVIDDEGSRLDVDGKPGKVKAMGLDLKRSDTPIVVQDFLSDILKDVLMGHNKDQVAQKIISFKQDFNKLPAWEKGTPKRVNKLTYYTGLEKIAKSNGGSARLPGHVRASYNYNMLRRMNGDNTSMPIIDGCKTVVCKLKNNMWEFKSVARPVDESNIPDWFKNLPFDDNAMSSTIIDKKVDNLLGVLNWDMKRATDISTTFNKFFKVIK